MTIRPGPPVDDLRCDAFHEATSPEPVPAGSPVLHVVPSHVPPTAMLVAHLRALRSSVLLLTLVASAAAQNTEDLVAWVAARFPQPRRATLTQCVDQARREGLLGTPTQVVAVKRAFRAAQRAHLATPPSQSSSGPGHSLGHDVETNDTLAWADDLGSAGAVGEINPPGDRDVFRLTLAGDATVQLRTGPSGPAPILDTVLTLLDDRGQLVTFNDNQGLGLYAGLQATLAAGTYFVQVEGYGIASGTYQLSLSQTPLTIPVVQANVPLALPVPGPGTEVAARLSLGADTLVHVTCTGGGPGFDPYLGLLRDHGGRVLDVDNAGQGGGFDPGLHLVLPAGNYLLSFGSMLGSGVVTLTASLTPAALPTLGCNTLRGGSIAGAEALDLYRCYVAGGRLAIATAPAGSSPIADTVVELFDRDLVRIARNDDDQNGLFGALDLPLPAGTCFVAVHGAFSGAGSYTVTAACAAAPPPAVLPHGRSNLLVAVPGQTAERLYHALTPAPLQVRTDNSLGSLALPQLTVLDATGRVVLSDLTGMGPRGAAWGGAVLPTGDYHLLLRDEFGGAGTCEVVCAPMLYLEPRWPAGTLNSIDKAGQVLVLLASTTVGPGIPLGPGPVSGVFLLSPSPLFVLSVTAMPPSGSFAWPFTVPTVAPPLQALSFDPVSGTGVLTNLER